MRHSEHRQDSCICAWAERAEIQTTPRCRVSHLQPRGHFWLAVPVLAHHTHIDDAWSRPFHPGAVPSTTNRTSTSSPSELCEILHLRGHCNALLGQQSGRSLTHCRGRGRRRHDQTASIIDPHPSLSLTLTLTLTLTFTHPAILCHPLQTPASRHMPTGPVLKRV